LRILSLALLATAACGGSRGAKAPTQPETSSISEPKSETPASEPAPDDYAEVGGVRIVSVEPMPLAVAKGEAHSKNIGPRIMELLPEVFKSSRAEPRGTRAPALGRRRPIRRRDRGDAPAHHGDRRRHFTRMARAKGPKVRR
jgi:hypothetical protein